MSRRWQRPCALPTATVACTWREALGPGPLEQLRDLVLAGVDAEHREHDFRAVMAGDLDACSTGGSLTRVPDTPANREAFGSAGTADDSSPYPQQRDLRLSHASTRATLAVASGPSGAAAGGGRDKGEAEQALLDKAPRAAATTATAAASPYPSPAAYARASEPRYNRQPRSSRCGRSSAYLPASTATAARQFP